MKTFFLICLTVLLSTVGGYVGTSYRLSKPQHDIQCQTLTATEVITNGIIVENEEEPGSKVYIEPNIFALMSTDNDNFYYCVIIHDGEKVKFTLKQKDSNEEKVIR